MTVLVTWVQVNSLLLPQSSREIRRWPKETTQSLFLPLCYKRYPDAGMWWIVFWDVVSWVEKRSLVKLPHWLPWSTLMHFSSWMRDVSTSARIQDGQIIYMLHWHGVWWMCMSERRWMQRGIKLVMYNVLPHPLHFSRAVPLQLPFPVMWAAKFRSPIPRSVSQR